MNFARNLFLWIATAILAVLPAALAIDFGGVLAWSQYISALAIVVAAVIVVPGLFDSTSSTGLAQHRILLPIGVLAFWTWFQTWTLPASLVGMISGGSEQAYSRWLTGLVPTAEMPSYFPVSVSPSETSHMAACWLVVMALAWASSILFHSRSRLAALMSAIALSGASVAVVGLLRKLNPEADWWFIEVHGGAFAGFVNRNNAALMLNLGLGSGLGLLSWRMMALHAIELDDPDFEFNDLISLVSDRESLIGIVSSGACLAGLLVNGSRGGFVAMLIGMIFAFGYVRPKRGKISVPIVGTVLALAVLIMTVPFQLTFTSLARLELLTQNAKTLQSDGRFQHWQDGLAAAMSYLPGGSGAATYKFAYLPFQDRSPGFWFDHADNMWLEMLVEYGVVGLSAVALIYVFVIIALQRLADSVDPLDQGIRVAAWYSLAAIFVSQFFDFGMAMPANLVAATMLAAAVISRDIANGAGVVRLPTYAIEQRRYQYDASSDSAAMMGDAQTRWDDADPQQDAGERGSSTDGGTSSLRESTEAEPKRSRWRQFIQRFRFGLSLGLAAVVLLSSLLALPQLRDDAHAESLHRRVEREYGALSLDPEMLADVESKLIASQQEHPYLGVAIRLASVQRDLGRLAETLEWQPDTLDQAVEVYTATNLDRRQLPYPPPLAKKNRFDLESLKHYRDAHATAQTTLLFSPLCQYPRATILELQPVLPNEPEIPFAISHLLRFYSGEPNRLIRLGDYAMQIDDVEQAVTAYRRAAEVAPNVVPRLIPLIRGSKDLTLAAIIPENPLATELAASEILQWPTPDDDFLRKAAAKIDCNRSDSLFDRARANDLVARIEYRLGRLKSGLEHSERAIQLSPDIAEYRITMIDQLMRADRRVEALAAARAGRALMGENPRFQQIIDQIAALDRQVIRPVDSGVILDPQRVRDLLK